MSGNAQRAGFWLAVIAAFTFSMKAIFVKLAYHWPVDAVTLLALRMLYSLPVFAVVGLRESRGAQPLTLRQWGVILLLGMLGYYGSSILDFIGLQYISASLERLILFSYPTLTLLLGVVLFGHRISRREVVALLLCYAGVAAAFASDLKLSQDSTAIWTGGAFVLASSICYAVYLTGSGRYIPVLGASRFAALALLVSTAATLLHFAVTQPLHALDQPWQVHALSLAMALISTVLPVFALAAAIRRIGPGRAALISTIGPIATIGMSWALLGEAISLWQWIGTALVVAGVLLVGKR